MELQQKPRDFFGASSRLASWKSNKPSGRPSSPSPRCARSLGSSPRRSEDVRSFGHFRDLDDFWMIFGWFLDDFWMIFKEFAQLLTQQGVPIPDMNSQQPLTRKPDSFGSWSMKEFFAKMPSPELHLVKGGGFRFDSQYLDVSENSVALNPMVLLIIIPFLNGNFIGNIPNIFRQTHFMILFSVIFDKLDPVRSQLQYPLVNVYIKRWWKITIWGKSPCY